MIKYILRKPLLPILMLAIMIFEVCMLGSLAKGIERDIQQVEELYDTTKITFDVLPGLNSGGNLLFRMHEGERIERLDFFERNFFYIECPYTLRAPKEILDAGWLFGTNDLDWFINDWDLSVSLMDSFNAETDWHGSETEIPCVVDINFAKEHNLKAGDSFTVAPYDGLDFDNPNAPEGYMKIVGTFESEFSSMTDMGLITPDNIFLDKPTFFFYWRIMQDHCSYRKYAFSIKPEYNRSFDEVEDLLTETLSDVDVTLHSDVRLLKKAIRPIEQRLQIQKMLEKPLKIAFMVVNAVLAILFSISLQEEIFLRRLWGEGRLKTFMRMVLSMGVVVVMAGFLTMVIGVIVLGKAWLMWELEFELTVVLLSMASLCIPALIFVNKNLVNFYQTKEN